MNNLNLPNWMTDGRSPVAAAVAQVTSLSPGALPSDFAAPVELPAALEALRSLPVWLLWKSIPDPKRAKPIKVPHYTHGGTREAPLDGPSDKAQLATFDTAVQAYTTGQFAGLALALGPLGDGRYLQGIDLDGVEEKGLQDIVETLPGYVETSPSGKGFHALGIGPSFTTLGANASGIEAYSKARFFTFTGQMVRGELTDLKPFTEDVLKPLHDAAKATNAVGGEAGSLIADGGRNTALHALGSKLRHDGLSREGIEAALMIENAARCVPPLDEDEVRKIAGQVSKYQVTNDVAGVTSAALGMFEPAGAGHPLTRYREFTGTIKAPVFVLPYLIPAKGLTVIAGAPGSGKTTNVLPLIAATAWCCPADHPMRAARPRRVVVISEDVEQVEQVLQAMVLKGFCTREQVSDMIKVVEAQRMPAARIVEARDEWRKLAMTHINDRGQPVELLPLIVLDTTSSSLDLESENDNAEVSRNIATLKQGLNEFPIVVIAHTSKLLKGRTTAAELAIRGASAFEGDSNKTLFMVVEDDGSRYLLHGKSRFEIPQDKQEVTFKQFTTTVPVFADFGMEMVTLRCSLAEFARAADRAGDKAAAAAERKRAEASANQQKIETEILKFLTDEYADGRGVNGTGLKKAVKCGNDVRQAAITHLLETGRAAKWYPPDSFYILGGCKKGNPLLVATTPDEQAAWQSNGGNMPAAMQAREDRERLDSS